MRAPLCLLLFALPVSLCAQEDEGPWHPEATICWHDDFSYGDVTLASEGFALTRDPRSGLPLEIGSEGVVVATDDRPVRVAVMGFDKAEIIEPGFQGAVSLRIRVTMEEGGIFTVVIGSGDNYASFARGPGGQSAFVLPPNGPVELPYDVLRQDISVQIDLFDGEMSSRLWLTEDPEQMTSGTVRVDGEAKWATLSGSKGAVSSSRITIHEMWISDRPMKIVPEPSGMCAAGLATVGMLAMAKRGEKTFVAPISE